MKNITLRNAKLDDSVMMYVWRNHESTRRTAFNHEPFTEQQHKTWLKDVLKDSNRHLFVVENNNTAVGVLRFDVEDNAAEISIYLDPEKTRRGIGTQAIQIGCQWLKENCANVKKIRAEILKDNVVSQKVFAKMGFDLVYEVFEKEI